MTEASGLLFVSECLKSTLVCRIKVYVTKNALRKAQECLPVDIGVFASN